MKTILVPVDFSAAAQPVTALAMVLARALEGSLVLLHVIEPEPDLVGFEPGPMTLPQVPMPLRDLSADLQKLGALQSAVAAESGCEVMALHLRGAVVDQVMEEAARRNAAMIVVGSHGHGALYDLLVGSVTHGILQRARCPVVVVPTTARTLPADQPAGQLS